MFNSLYFLKGAVALHALRVHLGDELFFKGFKEVFSKPTEGEQTLADFRQAFEKTSGKPLDDFFKEWYYKTGLPEY